MTLDDIMKEQHAKIMAQFGLDHNGDPIPECKPRFDHQETWHVTTEEARQLNRLTHFTSGPGINDD